MVKNISSTLNAKQTLERERIKSRMNANNDAISTNRDPVHVY